MNHTCLLVDIGNTRTKWRVTSGYPSDDCPVASGLFATTRDGAAMGIVDRAFTNLLRDHALRGAWISCVAGDVARDAVVQAIGAAVDRVTILAAGSALCGVTNGYDSPTRLGVDRWAALIGAFYLTRRVATAQPTLVVMAGTALTVDALSVTGVFLGGSIAPGLGTMAAALFADTAQLPLVSATKVAHDFARNTEDAINAGVCDAAIGVVSAAMTRLTNLTGAVPHIYLSGGDAKVLADLLAATHSLVMRENLVLDGLSVVAQQTLTTS